jgi:hypothetical protein
MRGRILIESVVGLGVASITLTGLVVLLTNVSHTALRISHAHSGVIATTKAHAALSSALRAREKSRLAFAVQSARGARPRLPNGGEHPLSRLTGATAPREDSNILSVIEVAQRCRGTVTEAVVQGDTITTKVCGLTCRIQSDDFKSFLVYAIDGVRQIVGGISPVSQACVEVRGAAIDGLVTTQRTFTSSPLVFVPVEREYSLFVDGTDTFRIASHIGMRVVENQPITQGITAFEITKIQHARGVSTYGVVVRPQAGQALSSLVVPGLAERRIWNEILP